MTRSELLPEILKLSDGDQAMIAEVIHERLRGRPVGAADEEELKRELDRRIADAEKNPGDQAPLDEVVQRLRARL